MRTGDVYIGRSCYGYTDIDWGNTFKVGRDGSLEEVIELYQQWIEQQPHLLARLGELRGKRLACWCKPKQCHGDVLAQLVEGALQPGRG
jgi:hypothetical protein